MLQCSLCNRWLCGKSSYHRHLKDIHHLNKEQRTDEMRKQPKPEKICSGSYICNDCGKKFFSKSGYKSHLSRMCKSVKNESKPLVKLPEKPQAPREYFTIRIPQKTDRVPCPVEDCQEKLGSQELLAIHCSQKHAHIGAGGLKQDYSLHETLFQSEEAFNEWLKDTSAAMRSSFRRRCSTETGEVYYRCHRSGRYRGSNKSKITQLHCPAFVRIQKYENGNISCIYCLGHILHDLDELAESSDSTIQDEETVEDHEMESISQPTKESTPTKEIIKVADKPITATSEFEDAQVRFRVLKSYHGIKEASVLLGTIAEVLGRSSDRETADVLEETNGFLWNVVNRLLKPTDGNHSSRHDSVRSDTCLDDYLLPVRCIEVNSEVKLEPV